MTEGYLLNARSIAQLKKDHQLLHSRFATLRNGTVSAPSTSSRREESVLVKVTELITGRVSGQLGQGKATVFDVDSEGAITDAERDDYEIYNDSLVPIPVDSYIRVSRNFRSGLWLPVIGLQTAIGKTSGGISARSGNTAGSGAVDIFYVASDGTLTDSGEQVSAYNIAGSAITASVFITIKRVEGSGFWVIDMEDCG